VYSLAEPNESIYIFGEKPIQEGRIAERAGTLKEVVQASIRFISVCKYRKSKVIRLSILFPSRFSAA
jgi:hypothetical protein